MTEQETTRTGGHAFPDNRQDGMTLLDYFAAAAIPALMDEIGTGTELRWVKISHKAYLIADAMVGKRTSRGGD